MANSDNQQSAIFILGKIGLIVTEVEIHLRQISPQAKLGVKDEQRSKQGFSTDPL